VSDVPSKATGHCPQSMANFARPQLTSAAKAFRGGAIAGGAELTGVEQR